MAECKSGPGLVDQPLKPSTARKLRAPVADTDTSSSPISKASKHRSPKGKAPRVASSEKKKPIRDDELVCLQEELKKAREELIASESLKVRYQQEAEEAKRELLETEEQLDDLSKSEEARVQELCKISHDRDKAWQSELEAVKQQHVMTSAALASAMNEISRLKIQLERVSQYEVSQTEVAYGEIHSLRTELEETLDLVENLKLQLDDARESEARAVKDVRAARKELELTKTSEETLKLELSKALESYSSLLEELEESKNKVASVDTRSLPGNGEHEESEIGILKNEVSRLKAAVKEAERMYHNEYIHSTLEIRNAYDLVEEVKSAYRMEEAESKAKLNASMAEVEELRKKLISMEKTGQRLNQKQNQWADRESELELELKKSEFSLGNLNASLLEKEMQLQRILEENKKLKSQILKAKNDRNNANETVDASTDAVRALKRESSIVKYPLSDEADIGSAQAELLAKELDAAQASKSLIEAELGRIKVQCNQWRKAAEAAAAMLSAGNNGKHGERVSPLHCRSFGRKLSSPQSEETDEDSPKKRNINMLKKITVLLKKGQK